MEPVKVSDGELQRESYSDADFAAENSDRKSLTGEIVRLNGMPVRQTAKKQDGVTLSTMGRSLSLRRIKRESCLVSGGFFSK
uniref:Uncharacterized protein n=1 Tax=Peronospora matthiolae TaxID=2874970 RepID=A0AAV1TRH3_9STRA